MDERRRRGLSTALAAALCVFTLVEVNRHYLLPQSQLAIFAMLGLVLCFLNYPAHPRLGRSKPARTVDLGLALVTVACCAYVVVQTQPIFESWWAGGQSLGNRAGHETALDITVGVLGLLLVIEATRRSIGWALPVLALIFLAYAYFGSVLPGWLFPHRGYGTSRIVAQTFLQSQGVFGTALRVMFNYVFLFVIFGALLRQTGATGFIIDFARRTLGGTVGGPAKVAVLSSGLMGSLSGSAVANTATTGTFTIPMMRSAGFDPEVAGGIEAAASSGGALVPPVMGAGAYMMLEIIEPQVTYLQIMKAALIPAMLYYTSLLLIVHFYSRRIGVRVEDPEEKARPLSPYEGGLFLAGFVTLITMILQGFTVFRAVSVALLVVFVLSMFNARTRITWRKGLATLASAGKEVIPLVAAASCVGIVIGVVTLTGVGTQLPATVLSLAQGSLFPALVLIMVSSIVLGMGLPSAVCYLLMATLIGPVLGKLGVVPLSAHLFIFYFGMMSMVTPPVALAAYTAASIAQAGIMPTGLAAFRFALVGFTLPYMFVFRPGLLMLGEDGAAGIGEIAGATAAALLGIVPFAAAISGYLFRPLSPLYRGLMFVAAALLLVPGPRVALPGWNAPILSVVGFGLLAALALLNRRNGGD